MKSRPTKLNNNTAKLPRVVGGSYIFFRENHNWHGCEVCVISIKGPRFTVARTRDVCGALLSPPGSKKRLIKSWKCTIDELW